MSRKSPPAERILFMIIAAELNPDEQVWNHAKARLSKRAIIT
jgi:hypothetical protein